MLACSSEPNSRSNDEPRRYPGLVLIDDMEDENTQTLQDSAGYLGFWYTYDDRKDCREDYCCTVDMSKLNAACATNEVAQCPGQMSPDPEPGMGAPDFPMSPTSAAGFAADPSKAEIQAEVAESKFAAHMSGEGYGLWGAGMGVTLNEDAAFDATTPRLPNESFVGIRFLGATGLGAQAVNVKVPDISGQPGGGMCLPKSGCGVKQGCYADWGKVVTLDSTWREYRILFSELEVPDFGAYVGAPPAAIDPTQLFQVQFQTDGANDGAPFDIWVDNVAFILANGSTAPVN